MTARTATEKKKKKIRPLKRRCIKDERVVMEEKMREELKG